MIKIIFAGILAIPCLLVAMVTAPIIALLAIPPLLLLIFRGPTTSASSKTPDHVIIAGGSSGIGLSIAHECVAKRGISKVTILARNPEKLAAAKTALEEKAKDSSSSTRTEIQTISVSVSDYAALEKVAQQDLKIGKDDRVILFNCAGVSFTTEFEKVPVEQYLRLVQTNQLGAMYLVRAFLPVLHQGCIVLTSSAAAQVGVYGYAAYSPTKYALRGFAETLHAELIKSHPQLHIQIAFPADTNTPGYEEEAKMMPEITKALNESAGLANPDDTAKAMVDAAFAPNPKFAVYFGLEGWMLANVTAGMSPVANLGDAIAQVALSGIFRMISLFVLNDWWGIIRTFDAKRKKGD